MVPQSEGGDIEKDLDSRYNLNWLLDYEYLIDTELIGRIDRSGLVNNVYQKKGLQESLICQRFPTPLTH